MIKDRSIVECTVTAIQLTSAGATALGYDGRGNLTGSGATAYTYTSENRLAKKDSTAFITYDSVGRISQIYTTLLVSNFEYDGTALISERVQDATFSVRRRYVHGPCSDEPLVWYEGTGTTDRRFLHADERGSVIATSDGTGAVTTINKYDEYGIPAATNAGRFQYTGQTWLPELGMYYYKARIYSPTLGRFMQIDPIGYGDGVNWYDYVGGDPVNGRDPSGLSRGDDDYWRGWSQWQRQSYCDQVSAQNCAVIDPLLEVGGRIYHLNLANSDPETKKAATDVFKLWACNPEPGTLYDSSRAAMLGGARRAESDRRAGRDRLERAFPVNSILGFGLLGGIRFYTFGNITVGSEDDVRQVGGDAGSYHSHIPDNGRGLSDADMVNAKTFFRGRSASFIVGLGFPSGRIAAYVETSRLGGSGETLGFICK